MSSVRIWWASGSCPSDLAPISTCSHVLERPGFSGPRWPNENPEAEFRQVEEVRVAVFWEKRGSRIGYIFVFCFPCILMNSSVKKRSSPPPSNVIMFIPVNFSSSYYISNHHHHNPYLGSFRTCPFLAATMLVYLPLSRSWANHERDRSNLGSRCSQTTRTGVDGPSIYGPRPRWKVCVAYVSLDAVTRRLDPQVLRPWGPGQPRMPVRLLLHIESCYLCPVFYRSTPSYRKYCPWPAPQTCTTASLTSYLM
ncbi:hypothetical protein HD554DRAFT_804147 [Boletus coccyginus]|nr:hypothetical protein HD554DRAFT_804147 [Boletus coccyginus]